MVWWQEQHLGTLLGCIRISHFWFLFFQPIFELWTGGEARSTNRTERQYWPLIHPCNAPRCCYRHSDLTGLLLDPLSRWNSATFHSHICFLKLGSYCSLRRWKIIDWWANFVFGFARPSSGCNLEMRDGTTPRHRRNFFPASGLRPEGDVYLSSPESARPSKFLDVLGK